MSSERHQRLMEILADALECDAAARANLLSESCREDESLRQDVEHLLRHETPAQSFLDEPLLDRTTNPTDQDSLLGKHIGPYLLTEAIGRGGMGSVYLAIRSDHEYQKQVAIKLINRNIDSELVQKRFRNERQILANLEHQNIARLLDGGTTHDGRSFLVMEYVSGQPIDVYADSRNLSTAERLKLFVTVCDAVEHAHENQVIHRDLKPSNILVNNEGVPKLLDFGISKVLRSDSGDKTDATTTTWRVLTPEYASPEQLRGDQCTAASDIYSLGAILYELLTGHRPHRNKKTGSSDRNSNAEGVLEPEKPSSVIRRSGKRTASSGTGTPGTRPEPLGNTRNGDTERLRRSLRGDLDNIVLMALRNEPERRYASVKQFSDDVRRHLEGRPIQARRDSLAYRGGKFFQRNRAGVISTAAMALLCLLIGLAVNLFTQPPKPTITALGVLPFVNVGNEQQAEYLADGLTNNLVGYLSRLPNLRVPGLNSVLRFKGQAVDAAAAARGLNVDTLMLGRTTLNGDVLSVQVELISAATNQIIWSQRFEGKPSEILVLQDQIAEEVTQKLGLTISAEARSQSRQQQTQSAEAYRRYVRGNHFWNLRTDLGLRKAILQFQEAIELDPNYALAYSGMANSYNLLGAYRETTPEESFPKAKLAAQKALELDGNLAEAYTSLAMVNWLYEWDWAAADQAFRRSIELRPSYVTAHHWYGLYLAEMGRFDEAVASEQRALELDPLSVYVNADLGRVYYYARRYDEALAQYRKTSEMNPNFRGYYSEVAQLYEQMGMLNEYFSALYPALTETEEVRKQVLERGPEVYWEIIQRRLMAAKPRHWSEYYELARVAGRLGKRDKTLALLNRAYEERDHFMTQIKVDPAFDSLRSDARFEELLKRMNLNSTPQRNDVVASFHP